MSLDGQIQLLIATIRSKINSLTSAVNGKEPSLPAGGTIASYLRGDKTWQTLATDAEPPIAAGATSQYWRGDKTWQDYIQSTNAGFVNSISTANHVLSGLQTVGGVAIGAGGRVLLNAQTDGKENGVWIVGSGAWARATDANTSARLAGYVATVSQGTQIGSAWRTTFKPTDTIGTNNVRFYKAAVEMVTPLSFPVPALHGQHVLDLNSEMPYYYDAVGVQWVSANGVMQKTNAQRLALSSPAKDAIVRETDTGMTYIYDGSTWVLLAEPPIATAPTTQYLRGDKTWRTLKTDALSTIVSPTAPSSPQAGQPWFDQSVQIYKVWDGTTWVEPLPSSLYRHQSDSGWITMTNTLTAGGTCRYRVVDGFITVQVDGSATTVSGTAFTIVTAANGIPAAYRPSVQMRSGAYFTAFPGTLTVGADGSITAVQSSGANRSSISGAITYPIV